MSDEKDPTRTRQNRGSDGRFLPGGPSQNPKGRPRVAEEIRVLSRYSRDELARQIGEVLRMEIGKLKDVIMDSKANAVRATAASVLFHAYKNGSYKALLALDELANGRRAVAIHVETPKSGHDLLMDLISQREAEAYLDAAVTQIEAENQRKEKG